MENNTRITNSWNMVLYTCLDHKPWINFNLWILYVVSTPVDLHTSGRHLHYPSNVLVPIDLSQHSEIPAKSTIYKCNRLLSFVICPIVYLYPSTQTPPPRSILTWYLCLWRLWCHVLYPVKRLPLVISTHRHVMGWNLIHRGDVSLSFDSTIII